MARGPPPRHLRRQHRRPHRQPPGHGALRPTVSTAATIQAGSLTTATAAPVAAWWARNDGAEARWRMLRNGTPEPVGCARADDEDVPALSADGSHVAYAGHAASAEQPTQLLLCLDGDGVASSDNLMWAPTFALKPETQSRAVLRGHRVSRVAVRY